MSIEKEWFENGDWNEGLQLKVHPSVDVSQFYKQYHKRPDLWNAAFEYLKKDLTTVKVGKYALKGDETVAVISEYQTKKIEEAKWESHRKFIDLQYIISGEEKMGVLPLKKAILSSDYQEDKDVIFFGEQDGEYYVANPDIFFLFFPDDVHRPCIHTGDSRPVKKLVVKITFAE
ncbi:MAG: YhcH/YjgK/YiaL family protein [Mangrovibacterium sp.]